MFRTLSARRIVLLSSVLLVSIVGQAQALFLFQQAMNWGSGFLSDLDDDTVGGSFETADGFLLSFDATVNTVIWYGGYDFNSLDIPAQDDFTISFFSGGSGPGALVSSYNVGNSVTRSFAGTIFGIDVFRYTTSFADTPTLLGGTSYNLSIANNTTTVASDWFWATGDGLSTTPPLYQRSAAYWGDTQWHAEDPYNLAFTLHGEARTAIPEPATLAVLALCMAGFAARRHRRRGGPA